MFHGRYRIQKDFFFIFRGTHRMQKVFSYSLFIIRDTYRILKGSGYKKARPKMGGIKIYIAHF